MKNPKNFKAIKSLLLCYCKKGMIYALCAILLMGIMIPLQNFNVSAALYTGRSGPDSWLNYETTTCTMTIYGTGGIGSYSSGGITTYVGDIGWLQTKYSTKNTQHIYISEGITGIAERAFYSYINDNAGHISYFSSINDIHIPATVSWIGNQFTYTGVDFYITDLEKWIECGKGFNDNLIQNLYLNDELISDDTTVVIPEGTTKIAANTLRGWKSPKRVIIPDSVTSIEANAFENCKTVEQIIFGNGLTSIGYGAFSGCTGLTSITIPDSVTSIDSHAFSGCTGLTSITIPDSVTVMGSYVFENCTGLVSVDMSNSLNDLYGYVFAGCSGLKNVSFGSSLKTIGMHAFENCVGLENISLSNSITAIGSYAFSGCTGLKNITIPDSVTRIGNDAFSKCTGLTDVTFDNGATSIGNEAFYGCTGLKSIIFGNSVTSIGQSAFSGCTGLTSITIPDSVTSIESGTFYNCTALTCITIPDSVKNISGSAFDNTAWFNNQPDGLVYAGKVAYVYKGNCPYGTSIAIKDGTVAIANGAFYSRTGLIGVTIPDSVTYIGENAFYYCTHLSGVLISNIFAWCNIEFANQYANPLCCAHSLYLNGKGLSELVIPDGVKSISDFAFRDCTNITTVTIPDSVTSIGNNAFCNCTGLTSITIPNSITSIGGLAFYGCTGLTSITIPDGVTYIGNSAFMGCTGLTSINIPDSVTGMGGEVFYDCTGLTNITIPDGVKRISSRTFFNCQRLKSITIPSSVSSIDYKAFYDCYWLNTVYYGGTEIQKSKISIDSTDGGNTRITNAKWIYNCSAEHAEVLQKIEAKGDTLRSVYMKTAIQKKSGAKPSDDEYNLRLISMIDCLVDYSEVGFYITIAGYNDGENDEPIRYSTDTVYTSLLNGGTRVKASDYGAEYFTIVNMTVPKEYYSANIKIKPYIVFTDGTEFSGNEINTTVSKYIK